MPDARIRPATAADIDVIIAMVRDIHGQHLAWDAARWTTTTPPHASYALWIAELIATPDGGVVFIAEVDRVIAGYALAEVEPESSRHWSPRAVYVHDVFVSATHRRLGLARSLMTALFAWAKRTHPDLQLRLMTAAPNEAARRFFATLGFSPCVVEMLRTHDV